MRTQIDRTQDNRQGSSTVNRAHELGIARGPAEEQVRDAGSPSAPRSVAQLAHSLNTGPRTGALSALSSTLSQRPAAQRVSAAPVVQMKGKPGDAPDSLESQLAARMEYIWSESASSDDVLSQLYPARMFASTAPPAAITNPVELVDAAIIQVMQNPPAPDAFDAMVEAAISQIYLAQGLAFPFEAARQAFEAKRDIVADQLLKDDSRGGGHRELTEMGRYSLFDANDLTGNRKFEKLASTYLERNRTDMDDFHEPSPEERGALSGALLRLPVVQNILTGGINELRHEDVAEKTERNPNMIAWLAPSVEAAPGTELTPEIVANVNAAMRQIMNMVDPEVLGTLPVPKVVVHRNTGIMDAIRNRKLSDVNGYRASASRGRQTIDIAENQAVRTIVHEIGHQLEYFLPTTNWLAMQRMLRMRHRDAVRGGSPNALKSIYPFALSSATRQEAAYQSSVEPVTGTYSAKHYEGGSTEVMSMSMEYFSDPVNARALIEGDPLQAAIVLRAIAPKQFTFLPREIQDLLPQTYTEL